MKDDLLAVMLQAHGHQFLGERQDGNNGIAGLRLEDQGQDAPHQQEQKNPDQSAQWAALFLLGRRTPCCLLRE